VKPKEGSTEAILIDCTRLVRAVYDQILMRTQGPLEATLVCDLVRDMFLVDLPEDTHKAILESRKQILPVMHKAFSAAAKEPRERKKDGQAHESAAGTRKKGSV
jgi:hypothetical protein